jgi:hypothetical protein
METQSLGMVESVKDGIVPIVKNFDANKKDRSIMLRFFSAFYYGLFLLRSESI